MFIAAPDDSIETARIYDSNAKAQGFVMNLTRAWAWRPEVFDSFASLRRRTLAKEAGAAIAAAVITDGPAEGLSERERALAAWARKVVADPNATTRSDVDALREVGMSDREILEATLFVAFRQAFSTVNDALGVNPDRELAEQVPAEVRAAVGYGRAVAES